MDFFKLTTVDETKRIINKKCTIVFIDEPSRSMYSDGKGNIIPVMLTLVRFLLDGTFFECQVKENPGEIMKLARS